MTSQWGTVAIEKDGKTYSGTYTVSGQPPMVTVSSAQGERTTQLGDSPAEMIARRLLNELVRDFR